LVPNRKNLTLRHLTKDPPDLYLFNKWVLTPILLLGIAGLAFGLWMIFQSGDFQVKKQTESPELTALKGEVQI